MSEETNKTQEMLVIVGRKWFDRVNGNTYFTANAYYKNKQYRHLYEYGYGDQYKYEMMKVLDIEGVLPEPFTNKDVPWSYCERNGIKLFCEDIYVGRKKDLHG